MAGHEFQQIGQGRGRDSAVGGGVSWDEECVHCGMQRICVRRAGNRHSKYIYGPEVYYYGRMADPLAEPTVYTYSCDQFAERRARQSGIEAP